MSNQPWYQLRDTSKLLTPALLVSPSLIRANFQEAIRIARGAGRLRPHVKTHKSADIVRIALDLGITKHKCATLQEAAMLAECSVPDILVAYPLAGPATQKFAQLVVQFPRSKFMAVVDNTASLEWLSRSLESVNKEVEVLVDIDNGMHRTGIPAGNAALRLYQDIERSKGVLPGGLHIYDGQNHQSDLGQRQTAVKELMEPIFAMLINIEAAGLPVPRLVCGGTPTFPVFAAMDDVRIECSPGTCALSDFNYGHDYQDMAGIRPAAVLAARVISRTAANRLTLDLGYKAVASDQPAGRRCHFLDIPDAREVQHSEEHLAIETNQADQIQIGDIVYALPTHICPTVALHSELQAVENHVIVNRLPVSARNRFYSV